jgi:hypothetical protein
MGNEISMDEIARSLHRLESIHEIQLLKHRYFRCIDTANLAELRELFHPDVTTDLVGGTYQVQLAGADAYVEFIGEMVHAGIVSQHNGHQPEIRIISDDEAEGRWYLYDMFVDLAKNTRMYGTAIYEDRYVRHEGRWVIRHSAYERIYEVVEELDRPLQLSAHLLAKVGKHHAADALPTLPGGD